MKQFSKPVGLLDLTENNIVNGYLPRRLFAVFPLQKATNGDRKLDPFNYADHNIDHFQLYKTGNETLYPPTFCNRYEHDYIFPCEHLLQATRCEFSEANLGINQYNFNKRNFFISYDLSPSDSDSVEQFDLPELSNLNLSVICKRSNTHALSLLVYLEYDAEIVIDINGKVTVKAHGL